MGGGRNHIQRSAHQPGSVRLCPGALWPSLCPSAAQIVPGATAQWWKTIREGQHRFVTPEGSPKGTPHFVWCLGGKELGNLSGWRQEGCKNTWREGKHQYQWKSRAPRGAQAVPPLQSQSEPMRESSVHPGSQHCHRSDTEGTSQGPWRVHGPLVCYRLVGT